jgi:glycosyltransferase involved in cell wall biosynthesis
MPASFSLVIPAYNESSVIRQTLESYYPVLQKNFSDFEIIVVTNNCTDNTEQIVRDYSKGRKVILFSNPAKGKGAAVRKGFELAKMDYIGFTDADASTSPQEFMKLFRAIAPPFDGAIASRGMKESVMNKKQPFHRRLLGRGFNAITNLLFGFNYRDTQCGAKIFAKKSLKPVLPKLTDNGFSFDVELLWRMRQNKSQIKEVAIVWNDSRKSSVGFLTTPKMLLALINLRIFGRT